MNRTLDKKELMQVLRDGQIRSDDLYMLDCISLYNYRYDLGLDDDKMIKLSYTLSDVWMKCEWPIAIATLSDKMMDLYSEGVEVNKLSSTKLLHKILERVNW